MSKRSAEASTFTVERTFAASAARVFGAWSNAEKKRKWSSCHTDWALPEHRLDFRVDGVEDTLMRAPDGTVITVKTRYLDIVPDERIVYSYVMSANDARVNVSLVTVTFASSGEKTKMTYSEHIVFLDGHGDVEERREGTEKGVARIEEVLA